ncbi:MAG: FtsX-like permease family protein [Bacteroidota bacterium]
MKGRKEAPPRWLDWILELYCRPESLEDLQGDLHEYYARNLKRGRIVANLIFFLDVLKFFRPYTVKKPSILNQMTYLHLTTNYFKTSLRTIARNRLFSGINIVGLAISMSLGIVMISYLSQLLSFDDFHKKKDRIYKVFSNITRLSNGGKMNLASASVYLGDKLREEYSGIEKVLIMQGNSFRDFSYANKQLRLDGLYASEAFFEVFSFELLQGDPSTALKEPYSIVLTERAVAKFFPDDFNPIGSIMVSDDHNYTVTAIVKDPPVNTHLGEFEMLESFSTNRLESKDQKAFSSWGNLFMFHVYVLLEEGISQDQLQSHLNGLAEVENAKMKSFKCMPSIKQLADISPTNGESNAISGNYTNWTDINRLIVLTLIILICSCFNYTNLSVARSLRRAREVGVRKVVGASNRQVFGQFIFEAVLISSMALLISIGLFYLVKIPFESEVIDFDNLSLQLSISQIPYFLVFVLVVGLFAGFLPAFVLSRLKAISILKDLSKLDVFKGLTLRKVLIILQFSVSMTLLISATISYRQYQFAINYDMGFRTSNIINIPLYGTGVDPKILKSELEKLSEVQGASTSLMIPGVRSMYTRDFYRNSDTVEVFYNKIDSPYFKIHEIEFLAGSSFNRVRKDSVAYVAIDENLRKELGFKSPEEAIGEQLGQERDKMTLEISGVMSNYEYTDLQNPLQSTALIQNYDDRIYHVNVLIESKDVLGTVAKIEEVWDQVDPVHAFEGSFYDVQVQDSYAEYKTMFRLFSFLSIIAVLISTMGLLGIIVFTTESRLKEISVRKVLGASDGELIILLARSFLWLLAASAVLAIPCTYYLFDQHILSDFRERIPLGLIEFSPGILLIMLIAIFTLVGQTLKAARRNPSDLLRSE